MQTKSHSSLFLLFSVTVIYIHCFCFYVCMCISWILSVFCFCFFFSFFLDKISEWNLKYGFIWVLVISQMSRFRFSPIKNRNDESRSMWRLNNSLWHFFWILTCFLKLSVKLCSGRPRLSLCDILSYFFKQFWLKLKEKSAQMTKSLYFTVIFFYSPELFWIFLWKPF